MSDHQVLVDTLAAAQAVERPPTVIRRWAHRGLLTRCGADRRGRTLYDLAEVFDVDRRFRRRPTT